MNDRWTDRLSEYLDGSLDPAERAEVEAHLDDCAHCRTVLDELRAVVERAGALEDAPPARDLWDGIEEAIRTSAGARAAFGPEDRATGQGPGARPAEDRGAGDGPGAEGARVIDLTTRRAGAGAPERSIRLTVPQLVAAALVLVFASGGGTLLLRSDPQPGTGVPVGEPGVVRAVDVETAPAEDRAAATQTDELAELEELLARHRSELAPNTVRILEKNLAAIDRAIEESLQALAVDPGNSFLEGHLERARQKKLEYLRAASETFQWST